MGDYYRTWDLYEPGGVNGEFRGRVSRRDPDEEKFEYALYCCSDTDLFVLMDFMNSPYYPFRAERWEKAYIEREIQRRKGLVSDE